ncbi:neprosin family prolyl endopeptidase [Xanthomonas graminis]|nr:neprosin family prolyl endopeptidase [Xanthomonas translucens]
MATIRDRSPCLCCNLVNSGWRAIMSVMCAVGSSKCRVRIGACLAALALVAAGMPHGMAAALDAAAEREVDRVMPALRAAPAVPQVGLAQAADVRVQQGTADPGFPRVTEEFARFRQRDAAFPFERLPATAKVADRAAFAQMQRYLYNRYNGVTVMRTLRSDGHAFDCIPLSQQPGLRGVDRVAPPPSTGPSGSGARKPPRAAENAACNEGTVPLERIGIEELAKASSLRDFLAKRPAHGGRASMAPEAAASDGHYYASVFADTEDSPIGGAGADINLWSPTFRSSNDYMSISQIWLVGESASRQQQTLEVGWQLRPSYRDWGNKSITFIYSTQDGYNATGCHNLECGDFVQIVSGNVLGTPYAANRYSASNGAQTLLSVEYQRDSGGNWWLALDGTWIGYYKAALYSGDLATGNSAIVLSAGGEILANDHTPSTPMGSGAFAATGYRNAAFQANHFYRDASLAAHAVTRLSTYSINRPGCYTLALAGMSGPAKPGVSAIGLAPEMRSGGFYFGGPGCAQ